MSRYLDFSSSMTGPTTSGPLQPQEDTSLLTVPSPVFERSTTSNHSSTRRGSCKQLRRKMTSAPPTGQPIQLTPLWEHVVRTREFPSEVDTRSTFVEISERLRDPEWEVRQHALRVLIDVLPTLNADVVDKVMQPVVPELINNLGHPAPAVRKGALDTLRVYLVHSRDKDSMVKHILHYGLIQPYAHNPFQTNVITGVILSAPLLLFPSSGSPRPSTQVLKDTTNALASRLVQIQHQEAVLKSLMKIRDVVGTEEFNSYIDYDEKLQKDIEMLSKIYNIKPSKKCHTKICSDKKSDKLSSKDLDKSWDSDSDTSGIAEEEDEIANNTMPPARVVLETEIKFNEETAITMTILEEKDNDDEEDEEDDEDQADVKDVENANARNEEIVKVAEDPSVNNQRKTPRRVHFGGEVVKLRTPDSDETESIEVVTPKTRIPLPVSPATKMPERPQRRRASSQPCSPHFEKRRTKRPSRSVSSSPKREIYVHNADLSPKKSILTRTSSPVYVIKPVEQETSKRRRNTITQDENIERGWRTKGPQKDSEFMFSDEVVSQVIGKKEEVKLQPTCYMVGSNDPCDQMSTASVFHINYNDNKEERIEAKSAATDAKEEINELRSPIRKTVKEKRYDTPITIVSEEVDEIQKGKEIVMVDNNHVGSLNTSNFEQGEVKEGMKQDECFVDSLRVEKELELKVKSDDNDVPLEKSSKCNQVSKYSDSGRASKCDHVKKSATVFEENESVTSNNSESEGKTQEPNWEELGLVDQEVLEDLHNKDDWRARVRALERVASALRTSSALITIEPRLGSLLHAVLGGERSCRVAAAGLAVAKVVVAGVTEDALRKRLPQLAWGLARQGGPSAAQLARIAMLRLRPALLLEQLLQPQCLSARNAKTRENALQLLIFSLVTFPSTEFKVDTVAHKVASMVSDKRRRVRQAALDTLAVLAQIYESEEVLEAGKRESESRHDGQAMMSAIRARLARKSLPLVSADGLVVYGLQISPTVQIATGPDVDWIVAGSGSVSPGTGRTRGQIIATSGSEKGRILRNDSVKNRESPWVDRPNFVALGVGLRPKAEQPVAWQIVPTQNEDDIRCREDLNTPKDRSTSVEIRNGKNSNFNMRLKNELEAFHMSSEHTNESGREMGCRRLVKENHEDGNDKNVKEVTRETESCKTESRIPILFPRDRISSKQDGQIREKNINAEFTNSTRKAKDTVDNNSNRLSSQQENIGQHTAVYQQRRKRHQEKNEFNTSVANQTTDQNSNSQYNYRTISKIFSHMKRDYNNIIEGTEGTFTEINPQNYQKLSEDRFFKNSNGKTRSNSVEDRYRPLSRNAQQQTLSSCETYATVQQRQRRFVEGHSFRPFQTAPSLGRVYQEHLNLTQETVNNERNPPPRSKIIRTKDVAAQKVTEVELVSTDSQTNGHSCSENFSDSPHRRRLRSLSPQLYHRKQGVRSGSTELHTASRYDIDKAAINEEEYNERNKRRYPSDSDVHQIRSLSRESSQHQVDSQEQVFSNNLNNSLSDVTASNQKEKRAQDEELYDNSKNNSRSSTPQSQNADAAFDVITHQTSQTRDIVESYLIPLDVEESKSIEQVNVFAEDDTSKDWSSEEETKSRSGKEYTENENDSDSSSDTANEAVVGIVRRKSIISVISSERIFGNETSKISSDPLHSNSSNEYHEIENSFPKKIGSPRKLDSNHSSRRNSNDYKNLRSPIRNCGSPYKPMVFNENETEFRSSSEERAIPSTLTDNSGSFEPLDIVQSHKEATADSPAVLIASRPHETHEYEGSKETEPIHIFHKNEDIHESAEESSINDTPEEKNSKDSNSETNAEPGILKIESSPPETKEKSRRILSNVSRGKTRVRTSNTGNRTQNLEKAKPMVQQCFAQLENKDWEITMKGLRALSQIAKQYPQNLDTYAAGTVGRLLGRHIRNLRSQVSRAACLAAGDIFSSQIRGVDQDLDDIAGPLLHRTADTNRFLRADSNAALDRMVEHLPPHRTIGIIVHRGASHQNAIVRAATARLLSEVVDRVGPEHAMILPRDVRDKLLNTGARLLMDGNLDARNHAKKMFRRLTCCEGFRKALAEAVPEATLRHIDKTLKSL